MSKGRRPGFDLRGGVPGKEINGCGVALSGVSGRPSMMSSRKPRKSRWRADERLRSVLKLVMIASWGGGGGVSLL